MDKAAFWQREGTTWPNHQFSRFVRAGHLRWHVQMAGTGPVLILVHGTGASTHSWRHMLPLLAQRFTVVAADLPGHGFTEPAGGAAYLSAIASPLPQLTFCPTGGITLDSAPKYLKLANVVCIGGSWMVARQTIAAADWPAITRAAQEAAALKKHRSFVHG